MCTVGVDPHSLPYSQFSFREGKQGEGRDVNWRGLATAVSLFVFFLLGRNGVTVLKWIIKVLASQFLVPPLVQSQLPQFPLNGHMVVFY